MPMEIHAETTTYDFNYSEEEDFSTVLQINVNKFENLTEDNATTYSSEFVVDYVTPSRDYAEVVETLSRVQELSNTLCEGISDDYDKMLKLHDYVCQTISYDHVSANDSADFNTICLKNVLDDGKTICAGYSNLFSALCEAQGMYCINIRGSARTNEYPNLGDEDSPTNHEWTAVWYESESRWVFVDCTWDSHNQYTEDGYSYDDITHTYFDMSMEEMSVKHKAKIIDHRDFFDAVNYFTTETTYGTTIGITDAPKTTPAEGETSLPLSVKIIGGALIALLLLFALVKISIG
jgi:transglutaminase/protease-like cytokinesis protein 3